MAKRILIVDDEPRYLRLLEANLRTEGYEVATAQDVIDRARDCWDRSQRAACVDADLWDRMQALTLETMQPTLGKWVGVELSADNFRQLMIPPGFAHGFATLTEAAEVQYKCTGFYAPHSEGSIRWDDPDIGIQWPFADPMVSARDLAAKSFKDYLAAPCFVYDGIKQKTSDHHRARTFQR